MTECLADLAGKPAQMWGWDGCRGAEGRCKWWMAVVRHSNCVQVIDPAASPFLALLLVSQALHLSFTSVPQMGENISEKKKKETSSFSWQLTCLGFSSFYFNAPAAASHLTSAEAIILSNLTFFALSRHFYQEQLKTNAAVWGALYTTSHNCTFIISEIPQIINVPVRQKINKSCSWMIKHH